MNIISFPRSGFRTLPRRQEPLSWGGSDQCTALFTRLFCELDATARPFRMLPEYRSVIEWMGDTHGKGLFLYGDCGRGKSVIIRYMIPALLAMKDRDAKAYAADEFTRRQQEVRPVTEEEPLTVLDVLKFVRYPIIDDVGTEPPINDYGIRYEGFSQIMAAAEDRLKPVFASTNLTPEQIGERYGIRTLDRIGRLCRCIEFRGASLR